MKKVYEAVLNIDPLKKEATGNYTCRKTFAFIPQSYVYLYAVGNMSALIAQTYQVLKWFGYIIICIIYI